MKPKIRPTIAPEKATIAPSAKKIFRIIPLFAPMAKSVFTSSFFSMANIDNEKKILKLAMPIMKVSVRKTKSFSIFIALNKLECCSS